MLKRTSILGIVIALIIIAGLPVTAACKQKKPSSEESLSDGKETQFIGGETEDDDSEGLSVDDEFLIIIDEHQGVDGF